jgi:hypothetical protein
MAVKSSMPDKHPPVLKVLKRLIMKKNDDDFKKRPKKDANQPSPDNQGIERESTKNVDEAAAEANRDIPALLKIYPKGKPKTDENKAANSR